MNEVPPVAPEQSLQRLVALLEAHNPELRELLYVENEDAFLVATERALDRAISTIEGGAKLYAKMDERGLSKLLADLMNHTGFSASAERYHNGHVDVVVEHLLIGRWKYLGECKIHRGAQYHLDGCEQILGYCCGRERRAFCLDFFRAEKMYEKLVEMREHFDGERPLGQTGEAKDHERIRGCFVTVHSHTSGAAIEVLHLGCNVCHSSASSTEGA